MNAAAAGLVGAAIGFLGNALVTWINKHFDERKARRELLIKTAWNYFSSYLEVLKPRGGTILGFDVFVLSIVKALDLALREDLSNQEVLNEVRKIRQFQKELMEVVDEDQ